MWREVAQSCPTLCYPMACSPPGSSVHGIFQARILEWVAISFSRGSSQPRDQTQVSCITGRCFNLWATREALGHMVVLFLVFKESSILSSIVTVSICSYHISHGKAHFSPSIPYENCCGCFLSLSHDQLFWDPMDYSLPGSSIHGASQATTLDWVAISFCRGSSWPGDQTLVSSIGRQILYHRATREVHSVRK